MIDAPIKNAELELAIAAATQAGQAVMDIYQTDFTSQTKDDDSPITEADLASNKIIKKILESSGHHILSEEDADDETRLDKTTLWIIDPLDGTSDFIEKTGEFTIMIALVVRQKPILGVINWPAGNRIYAAYDGRGAFVHENGVWKKISTSKTAEIKSARAVGSRHHLTEKEKKIIKEIGINFSSIGSSLKACKISSGESDVYFTYTDKMNEWDTAASHCIVHEAGGKMTDTRGNKITYNNQNLKHQNGIVMSNGILHQGIISSL